MRVELIAHTPEPELTVARAAKLCYSSADFKTISANISKKRAQQFVRHLIQVGHLSAIEHASFTFLIEGVSRAMTHQLVRHRLASYSQQSQRYVSHQASKSGGQFPYVIPPSVVKADMKEWFEEKMRLIQEWYDQLCERLEAIGLEGEDVYQDARYILPNATQTRIMVTMNARELRHFFSLRCCNRAQWEIRSVAIEMLKKVKSVAPSLFEDAGPACVRGPCPEGRRSCGKAEQVRSFFKSL